jgi:hypothetical protein
VFRARPRNVCRHGPDPQAFTNLKVLPKEIPRAELVATMRGFAGALGVRCTHCHVGPDDLQGMDFATDEKPAKQVARTMLRALAIEQAARSRRRAWRRSGRG